MAEFRQDSTAVTAITDIAAAAPGIFMISSVLVKGESPGTRLSHGARLTMIAIDAT